MRLRPEIYAICMALALWLCSMHAHGQAEPINDFAPAWTGGKTWKVEVETDTEPKATPRQKRVIFTPRKVKIVYKFKVEGIKETNTETYFIISIKCVAVEGEQVSPDIFHKIFVRCEDYTLKSVQRLRLSHQDELVEASRSFPRGPVHATDWVGSLPMDFPSFSEKQRDFTPKKRTAKRGQVQFRNSDQLHQTCRVLERTIHGKERRVLHIVLQKKSEEGNVEKQTTQTWIKGMPWWIEAVYKRNGRKLYSAKLIEIDGSEI